MPRRLPRAALLVAALSLTAVACASEPSDSETSTGGANGSAADPDTPASDDPASDDPTGSSLPPGCHEAPATTAIGVPGGGEIVCESPGDPGTGETLVPDTTVPRTFTAGEGIVVVTMTGSPCSRSQPDTPCIEIAELLTGTVTLEPLDGQGTFVAVQMTGSGEPVEASLAAGRWRVEGATRADRVCDAAEVTVVAGEVTDVAVLCIAP